MYVLVVVVVPQPQEYVKLETLFNTYRLETDASVGALCLYGPA